jgi:uncharacterized membrane protein YidH (DUF202 family)
MQTKSVGLILIVIGGLMMAYTGFNYVTTKKVVDLGPIQIEKKENHPVQWSPLVGIVLLVGGIVVLVSSKKSAV